MEDLDKRLSKRKSPDTVVIDSYQYTGMSFEDYLAFKSRHPNKLLVIISQAEGTRPEGYRAISKGRYFGDKGYYTIWAERAEEYWTNNDKKQ